MLWGKLALEDAENSADLLPPASYNVEGMHAIAIVIMNILLGSVMLLQTNPELLGHTPGYVEEWWGDETELLHS